MPAKTDKYYGLLQFLLIVNLYNCRRSKSNKIIVLVPCPEKGYVYSGNPIQSLTPDVWGITTWQECSLICKESTEGCLFWTWKPSVQTCYLKTSKAGRKVNTDFMSGSAGCGVG